MAGEGRANRDWPVWIGNLADFRGDSLLRIRCSSRIRAICNPSNPCLSLSNSTQSLIVILMSTIAHVLEFVCTRLRDDAESAGVE